MRIHKITQDRVFFIMDSGACGSVAKTDIAKLIIAYGIPEAIKIDSRNQECIIDATIKKKGGS